MKLSVEETRKWVQRISDDYMHYTAAEVEEVVRVGQFIDVEVLPEDSGIIGYIILKDFDCKKKMSVVILYCRPECRGKYLVYMFRKIEEIAKQEEVSSILIGDSTSGYKEEKFNRMLEYFGYRSSGHKKEI